MPRALLLVLLVFVLAVASAPSGSGQDTIIELTNSDIVTMVKAKLPPELIIAKIKSSRCRFDTFPTVLSELKYKGVSDEVLMAMVQAPAGAPRSTGENRSQDRAQTGVGVAMKSESRPVGIATGSQLTNGNAAEQSQITPRTANNIGGMILHDRSESPFNARFFVTPMDEGFDGLISALMLEKKLPLKVVADESLADFIIVGGTNKGPHKWYDTVFTGYERDRNQGSIRVIRMRDKTVIWAAQKGDRSFWWGPLKKGGRRKVAERLVNKMKGDLFKDKF